MVLTKSQSLPTKLRKKINIMSIFHIIFELLSLNVALLLGYFNPY